VRLAVAERVFRAERRQAVQAVARSVLPDPVFVDRVKAVVDRQPFRHQGLGAAERARSQDHDRQGQLQKLKSNSHVRHSRGNKLKVEIDHPHHRTIRRPARLDANDR
ncbi:MAG: hypothetical protein ACK559_39060, partial [bacterium]